MKPGRQLFVLCFLAGVMTGVAVVKSFREAKSLYVQNSILETNLLTGYCSNCKPSHGELFHDLSTGR